MIKIYRLLEPFIRTIMMSNANYNSNGFWYNETELYNYLTNYLTIASECGYLLEIKSSVNNMSLSDQNVYTTLLEEVKYYISSHGTLYADGIKRVRFFHKFDKFKMTVIIIFE